MKCRQLAQRLHKPRVCGAASKVTLLMAKDDAGRFTSLSLLHRVREHDQQAWERLVKIYSPLVFHWCQNESGLSDDDAADVMQDVFRSVAKSIGTFQKNKTGTFRGWLRTITVNKIRDLIRKLHRQADAVGGSGWHQQLQELPESNTEESEAEEETMVMRRAVELLEDHFKELSRKAFWLVVIDGDTAAESAQKLGMTEQAVWQACYRIRRRLREELADLIE